MAEERVWSISEINAAVRELIEHSLIPTWIRGEVGTLNIHRSGHVYLTLKDKKSQVKGVYFRGAGLARQMNLHVGMEVEVYGRLTVYEVRGEYQFSISQMRPVGLGSLQQRFEELKNRLHREGLFDPQLKKPIPMLPRKIGVVTSPGGAAIRDFLNVIERRFPNINVKIYPASVQGAGSELQVARGVDYFNHIGDVDVIVVTRGGGSMEDLWPFNEEVLARSIGASHIPVISAIGHEIDFTISDFVADLRVPTPSAAAELVVGCQDELTNRLNFLNKHMKHALEMTLMNYSRRFTAVSKSYAFREPAHMLREKQQRLDELTHSMEVSIQHKADSTKSKLESAEKSMLHAVEYHSERLKSRINSLEGRLNALNPMAVLERGYAIITDKSTNKSVLDADLAAGTKLTGRVAHGSLDLVVE